MRLMFQQVGRYIAVTLPLRCSEPQMRLMFQQVGRYIYRYITVTMRLMFQQTNFTCILYAAHAACALLCMRSMRKPPHAACARRMMHTHAV